MTDHPINGIMNTAMENLKTMVDVNTIVGNPVVAEDGSVIIPVSKVSFGLAAGGGEYSGKHPENSNPFAGGVGAGVTITPVAFLVANKDNVKLLPMDGDDAVSKLVDYIPGAINKICGIFSKPKAESEN